MIILTGYLLRHEIFFMWHKVFFVLPLTGNLFPVTRNILSFTGKMYFTTQGSFLFLSQGIFFLSQEKILLSQILHSICQRRYSSCHRQLLLWDGFISSCESNVCITRRIFSITGMIFHVSSSKKYFSCETKWLFFPVTQGVLPVRGFVPPLAMSTVWSV